MEDNLSLNTGEPKGGETVEAGGKPEVPILDGVYPLIKVIGRGGMGEVYLAERVVREEDTEVEQQFAVKILHPKLAEEAKFRKWFLGEAQALKQLSHENIVGFNMLGKDKERGLYYVMEYVKDGDGNARTLEAYLRQKGGKLPPEEAREVILQVCKALSHAQGFHSGGREMRLIHGDLKPENILLAGRDPKSGIPTVKVCDFMMKNVLGPSFPERVLGGTADKAVPQDELGAQPTMGPDVGISTEANLVTREYMAPEQRKPGGVVDNRADIYSLGRVIYRTLVGELPEYGSRSPHELDPEIPEYWDRIVNRCLKEKPEDRFASVQEIIRIVERQAAPPKGLGKGPRLNTEPGSRTDVIPLLRPEMVKIEGREVPGFSARCVPTFSIDREPISNLRFSDFVKAGAYEIEGQVWPKQKLVLAWTQEGLEWLRRAEPLKPTLPDLELLSGGHPVVGVSWFEAIAFCNWRTLTELDEDWISRSAEELEGLVAYRIDGTLNAQSGYRLPSEVEMVHAATSEEFRRRVRRDEPEEHIEWCATSYYGRPFSYIHPPECEHIGFNPKLSRLARNFGGTQRIRFAPGQRPVSFQVGFRCVITVEMAKRG